MTTLEKVDGARVELVDPESMNLLGLLMKGLLERNMAKHAIRSKVESLRGDIAVTAGKMTVTLRFKEGGLTILRDAPESPLAWVRGGMTSLLGLVTGNGMIFPVLTGKIRFGGNPFVLLQMLPLIQSK